MFRLPVLRAYLVGLSCTLVGAWGTESTGSMIPLALGAAATVMQTLVTVKAVLRGR